MTTTDDSRRAADRPCPCGRPARLKACCGRLHAGEAAADAESLMRSRYAAWALGRHDYLLATWHPSTRPASIDADSAEGARWTGLKVHEHVPTGPDRAEVEFTASWRARGRAQAMRERSRFVREDGRWWYVDAVPDATETADAAPAADGDPPAA